MTEFDDKEIDRQFRALQNLTREEFDAAGGAPKIEESNVTGDQEPGARQPDQVFTQVDMPAQPRSPVAFEERSSLAADTIDEPDSEKLSLIIRLLEDLPDRMAEAFGVNQ